MNLKLAQRFYKHTNQSNETAETEQKLMLSGLWVLPSDQFASEQRSSFDLTASNAVRSSRPVSSSAGWRAASSDSCFEQEIVRRVHHWEKGDALGKTLHVASSLSEWALVWGLALLFLSYEHELSHASIDEPAVRLVHIDGIQEAPGVSCTALAAAEGSASRVWRSRGPSMRSSGSFTSGELEAGSTRVQSVRSFALDGTPGPPLRAASAGSGILALNADPHIN